MLLKGWDNGQIGLRRARGFQAHRELINAWRAGDCRTLLFKEGAEPSAPDVRELASQRTPLSAKRNVPRRPTPAQIPAAAAAAAATVKQGKTDERAESNLRRGNEREELAAPEMYGPGVFNGPSVETRPYRHSEGLSLLRSLSKLLDDDAVHPDRQRAEPNDDDRASHLTSCAEASGNKLQAPLQASREVIHNKHFTKARRFLPLSPPRRSPPSSWQPASSARCSRRPS